MELLNKIITVGVGLLIAAIFIPIALTYIGAAGNTVVEIAGTNYTMSSTVNSAVMTVFTILLPVLAVIVLVLLFLKLRS